MPALAETVERALAPAGADRPAHAARLLVAGHAAEPAGGLGRAELGGVPERRELELEALAVGGVEAHAPALERLVDRRPQAGERERLPAGVLADRQGAARERRDGLATGEQQRERAALARPVRRRDRPSRARP